MKNEEYRDNWDGMILKLREENDSELLPAKDVYFSQGLINGDKLLYATVAEFREIKLIEGDFVRAWYIDKDREWGYEEYCIDHGMCYLSDGSFKNKNALQGVGVLWPAYSPPSGRYLSFEQFRDCAKVTFKR